MPVLTENNTNPGFLHIYDYNVLSRAKKLYRQGAVTITAFDSQSAACRVRDEGAVYTVHITAVSKQVVKTTCDCPSAADRRICKHIGAAAYAVFDHIRFRAINQWQYRLQVALEDAPRPKSAGAVRVKYVVVFGMQVNVYPGYTSINMLPYRIASKNWAAVESLATLEDAEAIIQRLDRDRSWVHQAGYVSSALDHRAVINLPPEGVNLYNLMLRSGSYYYGVTDFATYLPALSRLNAPIFRLMQPGSFKERIPILPDPVTIEGVLVRTADGFSLKAGFDLNGQVFTPDGNGWHTLTERSPVWVMAAGKIFQVENPQTLHLIDSLSVQIPKEDQQEFLDRYLQPIAERMHLKGDVIEWIEVEADPVPRLYLSDSEGQLSVNLRFGYGEHEVEADRKVGLVTRLEASDSWHMVRIHRRPEKEEGYYRLLADSRVGLKRGGPDLPPGSFVLRARVHPFDFLLHGIPQLTDAGFEIYGEESLKSGRINRNRPTISLNISSGVDWFDIQATIRFGDQEVSLKDIRRVLRKRERFVKLADGSVGQIPEEWLERYKGLFDLAEETEAGLRVHDYHLPLVDTLLADADESRVTAEFKQRRERLRAFKQINSHPTPAGFSGELRPYQKAGLDWLHFLHEHGFGGCLADDMGLGKTIQVLAFFQSLREEEKLDGQSLLVVPKSLLANWQREAERFTPELRFLEYMGNSRKQEAAHFSQYDVILTTYGTMLRDVDLLRRHLFFYVILDESQNIKNPLAQSSKATRLLNARHRLVLTGTPVENNTFDLWSQFAFLTPGLLGSVDYFKREFAAPIESRNGDETAGLLRKLVYPFILRRTKELVAPELPPRTERTLYTDFEPAQRKLYNQTRDYYRGMLLGIIDEGGIQDARMKVLEGLLRLRQICIHPALVDSAYRGVSAKFELLLETLDMLKEEGHKALVFSQFVQALHLLRAQLDTRHYRYTYLDGQTQDRQSQVDTFQNDPRIPYFLISLKAGGLGLNLTAADYVIHIDPWWNPAVEMQAADRAHRIGQDKPVFIYRLIARGSVEEKILQLQEHKKELVDQIISPETSFFKSITKEDVRVLFS